MRRRATNQPSRQSSPAAASRARPDQSSLGSLVRTAGTGTNGEHDPRAIGDASPPFVPMPLPPCAHHRRGMGLRRELSRTVRRRATIGAMVGWSPAAAPRARPDQSSLGSLVRTAGTGTNGEHDPCVTGDGSPPFVPMPLPSIAHHRRGMGCGGRRPTTHRDHRPPPPHPVPAPTNRHWAVCPARRARERTANMIRARHWRRVPPFVPMPLPSCAHHRRGMGCAGGRPTTHRTNRPPPPHPVPGPTNRQRAVWSARRARERTANMIRAPLATGSRRSSPCPYGNPYGRSLSLPCPVVSVR